MSILLVAGGVQAIFLGISIFRANRTFQNFLLCTHLIVFAIFIILPEIYKYYVVQFPHITAAYFPFMLLIGPSVYLYCLGFLTKLRLSRAPVHILPFVINYLYLIPFLTKSAAEKRIINQSVMSEGIPTDFKIMWGIYCIHILIYLYAAARALGETKQMNHLKKRFNIQVKWMRKILRLNFLIWGLYFVFFLIYQAGIDIKYYNYWTYFFGFSLSIGVYSFGYSLIKHPAILTYGNPKAPKYTHSGLNEHNAENQYQKLQAYIESTRVYTNAELSLSDLSNALGLSSHQLSQIINQFGNNNFYDFINGYRIAYARELLQTKPDLNVLEIAYDAGFNSKSTFNLAFKKFTGQTPTQFRQVNS